MWLICKAMPAHGSIVTVPCWSCIPAGHFSHATWHLPLQQINVMPSDSNDQHTQSHSHPFVPAATGMPTEIHGFAASVFLRLPLLRHLMAWMGVHSGGAREG